MVGDVLQRTLVGVVGGGEQPSLAEKIGEELTRWGAIVLTGGEGMKESHEAKDRALRGATEYASKNGTVARIIGVLPRRPEQTVPNWREVKKSWLHAVFIETALSSYQRDLINGVTPDVLIALRGGRGTLTEVGFGAMAHVPVIFADSLSQLDGKVIEHHRKFETEIIPNVRFKYQKYDGEEITAARILQALETALGQSKNAIDGHKNVEALAAMVVGHAMSHSSSVVTSPARRFPGIPGHADSQSRFVQVLTTLH